MFSEACILDCLRPFEYRQKTITEKKRRYFFPVACLGKNHPAVLNANRESGTLARFF
jgi:hypothetical protein|tara:strand:- start:404 stop:574 length:171 start_codon:yes stop_codon:yes gene_type:complete